MNTPASLFTAPPSGPAATPQAPDASSKQTSDRPTWPKSGGRKAGTPYKLTASVKAAIEEAFERVGSTDYLVRVAQEDPETFCTLLGKVLPRQMEHSGADGTPLSSAIGNVELARRTVFILDAAGNSASLEEIARIPLNGNGAQAPAGLVDQARQSSVSNKGQLNGD